MQFELRQLLIVLLGVMVALPLLAKNIYKYQDENGIWHFTDRAPEEGVQFETVYMEREREDRIRLRQQGTKQNPLYHVFNDYWGPVQVELSLQDDINVLSEPQLPARFVIPGQTEKLLAGLGALDTSKGFQYRLVISAIPGPPKAERAAKMILDLPFAKHEAYIVSQGFNGGKTHLSEDSTYAIDIAMPERSMVHAVREGVVRDGEEDVNKGGMVSTIRPIRLSDEALFEALKAVFANT